MTLRRIVRDLRRMGTVAAVLLVAVSSTGAGARGRLAQGGVFERADAFGCAKPEDYARIASPTAADRGASGRLRDRLIGGGACALFVRGEPFTVEEERGDLVCLRPQSERDCLWSGRASIAE